MRENRTYGSEGGEPAMDNSPTPITKKDPLGATPLPM